MYIYIEIYPSDRYLCTWDINYCDVVDLMDGNFTAESAAQVIFSCVQTSRRLTSTKLSSMTTCNQNQSISSSSNWVCILLYRNSANEAFKVESLLIEKPDNQIGFVVDYLQKKSVCQLLSNF